MAKREQFDLTRVMAEASGDPIPVISAKEKASTPIDVTIDELSADLIGFTVRLPKNQKEALERYLWGRKGEKLAAGVRRILTEFMERERIT